MRRLLLFAAAFLFASPLFAQQTCADLVPKLLDVSGMNASLAKMPDHMREAAANFSTREGSLDVEKKHAFENVLLHAFDEQRMAKNIKAKLMSSCDAAAYSTVLGQMESPLEKKFVEMELRPQSSPEEATRMQRFIASFPMQSPRESRMRLVQQLMDTDKLVDTYADFYMAISTEMTRIIRAAPTRQQVEDARAQLIPIIQEQTEAELYYTYRPATDDELKQYIAMQASKEHQRFTQDITKALLYAIVTEADEMAVQLKSRVVNAKETHQGE